jgi:hypothetical protein
MSNMSAEPSGYKDTCHDISLATMVFVGERNIYGGPQPDITNIITQHYYPAHSFWNSSLHTRRLIYLETLYQYFCFIIFPSLWPRSGTAPCGYISHRPRAQNNFESSQVFVSCNEAQLWLQNSVHIF